MFLMSLWRTVAHRNRLEADLDDEMRAVFEILVEEKIKGGATPAEARRAGSMKLGVEQLKEHVRDVRVGAFVESVFRDVGFAVRALRRSPGFAIVAILTLAIGIGANTAIFSLLDAVMFKPLPVNDANQLFVLSTPRTDDDAAETGPSGRAMRFSYPAFLGYASAVEPPASLAAMSRVGSSHVRAAGEGLPLDENIQLVSGGFFSTFPVAAERGRLLTEADERDAVPVAVVSDFLWRRRFGGLDSIIGRRHVAGPVRAADRERQIRSRRCVNRIRHVQPCQRLPGHRWRPHRGISTRRGRGRAPVGEPRDAGLFRDGGHEVVVWPLVRRPRQPQRRQGGDRE